MKRKGPGSSLWLALVGAVSIVASASPTGAKCQHVAGTFEGGFTGPDTAEATIVGGAFAGSFASETYFNFVFHGANGQGALHFNGMHTIQLSAIDTLFTYDEIRALPVVDPDPGLIRVNSRLAIIGGTGRFIVATGLLHTHGYGSLTTGWMLIDFKGQVCVD